MEQTIEEKRRKNREYQQKWRDENREKYRAVKRARYAANPELYRQLSRDWTAKNPEKAKEKDRKSKAKRDKEHVRAVQREWRRNNPEKVVELQRRHRLRVLGAAGFDFDAAFVAQGCACAICGTTELTTKRGWHIDHDHQTGAIRGILCHHCNVGIGNFKDNTELLARAIVYLQRF
jgi:hypothetical protein